MRAIPSAPGYHATADGEIIGKRGSPLKTWLRGRGYESVRVGGRIRYVHDLVAEAFHGEKPEGHHTHHKDKNKLKNHYTNLEYMKGEDHNAMGRETKPFEIYAIHLKTGDEERYPGIKSAAKRLGVTPDTVDYASRGSIKEIKGHEIRKEYL